MIFVLYHCVGIDSRIPIFHGHHLDFIQLSQHIFHSSSHVESVPGTRNSHVVLYLVVVINSFTCPLSYAQISIHVIKRKVPKIGVFTYQLDSTVLLRATNKHEHPRTLR